MSFKIAVAGATGAVGHEMLRVLERRAFPVSEIRLLASERSAGKRLPFAGAEVEVEPLSERTLEGLDLALFSAGSDLSRRFARAAGAKGTLVVDNSSAFRLDDDVPLIVPEINPEAAEQRPAGIVANPNCTTIISLMALAPIHRAAGIVRFTAASYQAASGAGARAMAELEGQVRSWAAGEPLAVEAFPHQLAFNCLPHVDAFLSGDGGYTKEEMKLVHESRKILGTAALRASCTCVRVPVLRSHAVAIHLETERPLSPAQAREAVAAFPGVEVWDEPETARYPMQLDAAGRDEVLVGRVRRDCSHEHGLALWVVGDQLLKGAALNAVQCAELALGAGAFAEAAR